MTTQIANIGRLRSYLIVYRTDLTRADASQIPLGIMADMRAGPRYGIGLRTRHEISEQEASQVGQLVRPSIIRPFRLLREEFERVRGSKDPASSFRDLSIRHSMALAFVELNTDSVNVPSGLLANVHSEPLRGWVIDQVQACLAKRFWDLVDAGEERGGNDTEVADLPLAA